MTDVENNVMVTSAEKQGGIKWETGIDTYTLLYISSVQSLSRV